MDGYLPLAEQIKILFDAIRHPEGRPFTLQEVSEGSGISLGTVGQMRSGKIVNPQLNTLRGLCRFFDIPLRYFETKTREECYALLATPATRERPALGEIAFRASELTPLAQQDILTLIKMMQAEEAQYRATHDFPASTDANEDMTGNDA